MKKTIWVVYVLLTIVCLHVMDRFYGADLESDMESMAEVVWNITAEADDADNYTIVEVR